MSTVRPEPQLLSAAELANQAEVTPEYVLRLIEIGCIEPTGGDVATKCVPPWSRRGSH